MKFPLSIILRGAPSIFAAVALPVGAQIPNTLRHSLPAPIEAIPPSAEDNFGSSVAIFGSRAVVGVPFDDTGAINAGRAYVYNLSSGTPTVPVVTILNPSPSSNDYFGFSVAISGARVVIGAFNKINATGIAYVYDLDGGTPAAPVWTLNNPSPAWGDEFGRSVAIAGARVVIGAAGDDTGATNAGSVYVYDLSSGTPSVPAGTLSNTNLATAEFFGSSVAMSGSRVVIGAPGDQTGGGGEGIGSVSVYDFSEGTPSTPVATIHAPFPAHEDFGRLVAISGPRVVIGSKLPSTFGWPISPSLPPVNVYDLGSGAPVRLMTLSSSVLGPDIQFGDSFAISGTLIAVGANWGSTGADRAGEVYLFDLTGSTPDTPVAEINNPAPADGDRFGLAVALDGSTAVIGTPYDDAVMFNKGAAYVFGPHPLDQDSDGLLDAWELTYWPSTTGHSPLDDDDHDGLVNLLELAFVQNPTLPNGASLPAAAAEGGYLTMTITKQAGVTYEVQSAGSLLPALPDSFSASTTTVLINDATTLKVRDNFLISSSPGRFLRVKVTAAP